MKSIHRIWVLVGLLSVTALPVSRASAHCDGLDGPVVSAARQALKSGDVNAVLVWVQSADEPEIRRAFEQTRAVRKLSADARELADRYFFETLVRVHRAGEGAPYTGLKPAGRDLGPAIPAADTALQRGDVGPLVELLTATAGDGIRERFDHARSLRAYEPGDVEAGRGFVAAYVAFIHYVEGLHEAARRRAEGHYPDAAPADHSHHPSSPDEK